MAVRIARDDGRWAVTLHGVTARIVVHEFVEIDRIVEEAASAGIDHVALSPWISLVPVNAELTTASSVCALQNESLAAIVRDRSSVSALGIVPLQFPDLAAREVAGLVDMGLSGIHVPAAIDGRSIGEDRFAPFWEAVEASSLPVLVHPTRQPLGLSGLEHYHLGNALGHIIETAVTGAQMVMSGLMERHPHLRVILSHGGGCLLAARGRLRHAYASEPDARTRLSEGPDVSLRRFYYDTVTHDADLLGELISYVGAERVLLGSDQPFTMGDDRPVELVRSLSLDPRDEALILEGNARRLIARDRTVSVDL